MNFMTFQEYKELEEKDSYYKKSRWEYFKEIINILKKEELIGSVLELGPYKRPIVDGSDTMDKRCNIPNLTYCYDATNTPWPIEDSKYDMFIALQVWEHLRDKQKEVFEEVMRVSNRAVLSFPLNWYCSGNKHHNITEEKIAEWTHNIKPVKKVKVGEKNTRIIYLFHF